MSEFRNRDERDDGFSYTPRTGYDSSNINLDTGSRIDDDATIFDERLKTQPNDLDPKDLPVEKGQSKSGPVSTTRLGGATFLNSVPLSAGGSVFQALPANPRRVYLKVSMVSTGASASGSANDEILIADDFNRCQRAGVSVYCVTSRPLELSGDAIHTGPVFIGVIASTTNSNCHIMVTEVSR